MHANAFYNALLTGFQWQICPNNPVLAPLPDFLRPTRSQRFVAHDPLINFMPW